MFDHVTTPANSNFANNLLRTLAKTGLNNKQLAARAGMTPTAIGYYLQARREPTATALKKIADALGVAMEDLLRETPAEAEPQAMTREAAGAKVKALLEKSGWSQRAAAAEVSVTVGFLNEVLLGRATSWPLIAKLFDLSKRLSPEPRRVTGFAVTPMRSRAALRDAGLRRKLSALERALNTQDSSLN